MHTFTPRACLGETKRAPRPWGRVVRAVACAAVLGAVAAAPPAAARAPLGVETVPVFDADHPSDLGSVVLTSDSTVPFSYAPAATSVEVAAPDELEGLSQREAWWAAASPMVVDGQACMTWSRSEAPIGQPGIALRIRQDGARVRTVTVVNNVYAGYRTNWNLVLFDSADSAHGGFTVVEGRSLYEAFRGDADGLQPLPWRLCARVRGDEVDLKAWPLSRSSAEPTWDDPTYNLTYRLPPGWVFPGHAGWFVGHVLAGEQMGFDDLASWQVTGQAGYQHQAEIRAWVDSLYPLLFGRQADGGAARWTDQTMAGSAAVTVAKMGRVSEARNKTVAGVYRQVLRREPDPVGRAHWAATLLTHPDLEALTLSIVMSNEFSGRRMDRAFVADLYERLYGRPADVKGLDHWTGRIHAGVPRRAVASAFIQAAENRTRAVRQAFVDVLDRQPSEEELVQWRATFVQLGLDRLRLRAALAASLAPPAL
jgi:hypothetical protein